MTKDRLSKSFYIVLVPVILVVILINSGFLQAHLPAVSVGGTALNVAQYNYYYFTEVNTFQATNFDASGNGPYDMAVDLSAQLRDDGVSWKEYFQNSAETAIQRAVCYSAAAEKSGYAATANLTEKVDSAMQSISDEAAAAGITLKNYLVAYYGVGMTEDIFREEVQRCVLADSYASCLMENADISDAQISAWITENTAGETDFNSVKLRLIILRPAADRFTGDVTDQQLADLKEKLYRLEQRYLAGEKSISYMAAAYNDDTSLAAAEGLLDNALPEELPVPVAEWAFAEERKVGDYLAVSDQDGAYFAVLEGWGISALRLSAVRNLQTQAAEEAIDAQSQALSYNPLGVRLICR